MEETVLKPTKSKIIVSWLVMSAIILVISLVLNPTILSDITIAIIVLVYLFSACLVFNLIFYNLPFFKVEITKTHFIGPDFPGLGWRRAEIPVEDIDLNSVNSALQWLGLYIFKTKRSGSIALWGFDEERYQQFNNLIKARSKTVLDASAKTAE